jgi:hypothetical protein
LLIEGRMLAAFCFRLAVGLLASLLLLSPRQINPRFYRTLFLTAFALAITGLIFTWDNTWTWLVVAVGGAAVLAVLGSLTWSFEEAPGGRVLIVLTLASLLGGLVLHEMTLSHDGRPADVWLIINGLTSAALLGTAMTAMLMGHSYLTAPAMSMRPLLTLLAAMGGAIVARTALAGTALAFWTQSHSLVNLNDVAVLWLPVRWLLGIVAPLILGLMAWSCARIRSTQSATGILYVVVIFCFLGELMSLLLLGKTFSTL